MVVEAKSIVGSSKGLRYQSDDKGNAKELCRNALIGENPTDWHKQMREVENKNSRVQNKRFSFVLAPSKEVSSSLQEKDWMNLVYDFFSKMNIDHNDIQFIAHLHTSTDDRHVHVTVSRIPLMHDKNFKYNAINDNQIGIRAGKCADQIAKQNGWKTAKEISQNKRALIGNSLRTVLKTSRNFDDLAKAMQTHGFTLKYSENEAKGIYGMRIILNADINANPSIRAINSKQGYKLSEIDRYLNKKTKFTITDIKTILERNYFNSLSPQQKLDFATAKNEKLFGGEPPKTNIDTAPNLPSKTPSSKKEDDILQQILKPTYTSTEDDFQKKKKKKKR